MKNIIAIIVLLYVTGCSAETTNNMEGYQKDITKLTIAGLIENIYTKPDSVASGNYIIDGIIIRKEECLSLCKSSIPDFPSPRVICPQMCIEGVTIGDPNNTEKRLVIYGAKSDEFLADRKFRFTVELTTHNSNNQPIYRLKSLGFKRID